MLIHRYVCSYIYPWVSMQLREINITFKLSFWDRVFHWSYSLPHYWLDSKPASQDWGNRHSPLLLHGCCYLNSGPTLFSASLPSPEKFFLWWADILIGVYSLYITLCSLWFVSNMSTHTHTHTVVFSYFSLLPSLIKSLCPLDSFTLTFMSYLQTYFCVSI